MHWGCNSAATRGGLHQRRLGALALEHLKGILLGANETSLDVSSISKIDDIVLPRITFEVPNEYPDLLASANRTTLRVYVDNFRIFYEHHIAVQLRRRGFWGASGFRARSLKGDGILGGRREQADLI